MNDGVKGRGPREKMAERGIGALDDTELLALLLGSGAARRPVIELAGSLLLRFGGLRGLLRARRESLERQPGLGPAKTGQLLAVLELSRRYLDETLARGKPLESPDMTERYLKTALRDHPHEVFAGLFLDTRHRVIAFEEMFHGTIDGATVYPRVVVEKALGHGAAAVIVAVATLIATAPFLMMPVLAVVVIAVAVDIKSRARSTDCR